jgi:hypothetical protein
VVVLELLEVVNELVVVVKLDEEDGAPVLEVLLVVGAAELVEDLVVTVVEEVVELEEDTTVDELLEVPEQTNLVDPIIQGPLMLKDSKRMLVIAFRFAAVPKALRGTVTVTKLPVIRVATL